MVVMIAKHLSILLFSFILLLFPILASGQLETDTPSTPVDFFVMVDPLSIALETWDDTNPPDTVKMAAYEVASGFLAGVPFHFEANRDRITITQQVDRVAQDLEYKDLDYVEDCIQFNYTVLVPNDISSAARNGKSYQGHGVSQQDDIAAARDEAWKQALDEAIRAALSEAYIRQNKPLPGYVDGRIAWYEISSEDRDPESGDYVVDLVAWLTLPVEQPTESEPQQP
jgi:hypothetical protein